MRTTMLEFILYLLQYNCTCAHVSLMCSVWCYLAMVGELHYVGSRAKRKQGTFAATFRASGSLGRVGTFACHF